VTLPDMAKSHHKLPVPTGNPWLPSHHDPATVPVPFPVIIVKVEGSYTERDRKLWTFLLYAVWDELDVKPIHELPIARISQVFRELGGEHDSKWIWESAGRLTRTIIEWERTEGDERYNGVSSLFQAEVSKQSRTNGILRFAFPSLLIPILKDPRRFARLRVHFLIGLSGKYAVTLYELLESVVNKINPILDVQLDTIRQWLKVPDGKLNTWDNFNRRALSPAIDQINANPLGAGFTVEVKPIKIGRAVHRIHFHVHKVDERQAIEEVMQENIASIISHPDSKQASSDPDSIRLSTTDYEKAKKAAPDLDIYYLEQEWRRWLATREKPQNPSAAFIAFCRKKYQAHNPSSKHPARAGSTRPG
jgi:hypothetical protein